MAKRFKITENQYNQMLAEGIAVQGETTSDGKPDISKTGQNISANLKNANDATVTFKGSAFTGGQTSADSTSSIQAEGKNHRLITKRELQANRLRYLKENSEVLSFNNFIKKLH